MRHVHHWPPRVEERNPRFHYLLPFVGEWACECGERVRANPDLNDIQKEDDLLKILKGITYQHGHNREARMTTEGHEFTEEIEQELEWVVRIHEYTVVRDD